MGGEIRTPHKSDNEDTDLKLDKKQSINLVEILDQASLSELQIKSDTQDDWEKRVDEIRSDLKRVCIDIESKGLAECMQTGISSHRIKMTDTKPIRYKLRPIPYHCRKEF